MTLRRAVAALTAVALAACYAATLRGMFDQWSNDEDMGHGSLVPLVILWIIWRERERWRALPVEPSWWGFPILAAGAGMQALAALGGGLFASSVALLVSVAGVVVCLGGFAYLHTWAFPFALTLFMLPKLAIVYYQVSLPLQLLASRIATAILSGAGVSVVREGIVLNVAGHRVAVEEACNGMRYLLSLGFSAVVFAYLSDSKPWMRTALLAAALPVAVLANAARVAADGFLPALTAGAPHAVSGWLVFVLCLAALALVRRFFNVVYARYHA
jgi:exosortase